MLEQNARGEVSVGRLIVVEGIDGSGSTTQVQKTDAYLRSEGYKTFTTHEPSDGPAGMLIRLALSGRLLGPNYSFHDPDELRPDGSGTALDPHTLALLFAADRADHVAAQIRPNLERKRHVLCDRYILSTLAYQGLACDLEWLIEINRHIIRPDLTFFLDVPPAEAALRMQNTRWKRDLYEEPAQQRSIRDLYFELIDREIPFVGPVVVIDSSRTPDEVSAQIKRILKTFLTTGQIEEARGELTLL